MRKIDMVHLLVMTYLPEIRGESSSDFIVPTSSCALLVLNVTPRCYEPHKSYQRL